MTLRLRLLQPPDAEAARILLGAVWPGGERTWAGEGWGLERAGKLTGLGRVLPINTVYPYSLTLDLALNETGSAADAAALGQHLMATFPAQVFWRAQCLERHRAVREGLTSLGFAEVRRTWTPQVPLPAFPGDWQLTEFLKAAERGYTVHHEPALGEAFRAELTRAHLRQYQATHGVNPPADLSSGEWKEVFLEGLDSVVAARRSGNLAAFASVRIASARAVTAYVATAHVASIQAGGEVY